MLRKIPFNSNLISIGNSPHYDGQLVYSDGRVAYGWQYNVQQPTTGINRATAGLWVRAENNTGYVDSYWCLMDENLNFENVPIRGLPDPYENVYSGYCYPWVYARWDGTHGIQHGEMILDDNTHYEFIGDIVRVDNTGKILTFYSEYDDTLQQYTHDWLCSYSNDGSVVKTDIRLTGYDTYRDVRDWYKISYYGYDTGVSMPITALDTTGGYITVKTTDPDNPYIHFYCANGTCTEAAFPTQMVLSDKARLLLPSLDLVVNGVTYRNDILKLLNGRGYGGGHPVNGVHAYNDIIISQFSNDDYGYGYMFKNGVIYDHYSFYDREEGTGVTIAPWYCWSLAEIPGGQWYINYNPFE